MTLNVAVCIKSVPDPLKYSSIVMDPVTKTLVREGVPSVLNPTDLHAIELAMQLKETQGAKVTLLSMGPLDAQKELREGLAYGADEAFLLSDKKFGGADSLATSYTLALGAKKTGPFDLILLGNESADGGTSHVPSQLGEWLELPHLMEVVGFTLGDNGKATVRKKTEDKFYDFEVQLPVVIAVSKEINKVRIPNMKGVLSAKKKPLVVYTAEDFSEADLSTIGLAGSPTQNGDTIEVSYGRRAQQLTGSSEEIAGEIWKIIQPIVSGR